MDEASFRAFAERLLSHPGGDRPAKIELLPGGVPDDFPFTLPLKPGWRVVGSTTVGKGTESAHWTIVLDAFGTMPSVAAYFENELGAQGWKVSPWDLDLLHNLHDRGFMASPAIAELQLMKSEMQNVGVLRTLEISASRSFHFRMCQDSVWLMVGLVGHYLADGTTDVHLDVRLQHTSRSCDDEDMLRPISPVHDLVPRLFAPDGVSLHGGSRSSGSHSWTADITAITKMPAEVLEAHYEKQLASQGWTRLDGHATSMMAWSLWSIPYKEKAQGLIYVLQNADEGTFLLSARIDIDTGSFWASHGGHSAVFGTFRSADVRRSSAVTGKLPTQPLNPDTKG